MKEKRMIGRKNIGREHASMNTPASTRQQLTSACSYMNV